MMTSTIPPPPTSFLPPLAHLSNHPLELISSALSDLRSLYFPPTQTLILPRRHFTSRIHDLSVPDSGYASAEEAEEQQVEEWRSQQSYKMQTERTATLMSSAATLSSASSLTGFVAQSDVWLAVAPSDQEDSEDTRALAIDEAASLLSAFAGHLEPETALVRTFSFPCNGNRGPIEVTLNDAPLLNSDHTSVGLQSWASSIVLAEKLCFDPIEFHLDSTRSGMRILELGAGTGVLSIVTSKLLPHSTIVATDYHPDVLSNLRSNIDANAFSPNPSSIISVHTLDWSEPPSTSPFDTPFDIILAADVVYHPLHAQWIKSCAEKYLAHDTNSLFWLIIPLRTTGRHEGMGGTVEQIFPAGKDGIQGTLVILYQEEIARKDGVGRADEGSYLLFKIGRLY